jgi:protein-tyrosine phosphatase
MRAEVYPIKGVPAGRLAIMPRPRAGDWLADEIASWQRSGLDAVVSLLEDREVAELELDEEAELCGEAGLRFLRLPIADRGVPDSHAAVTDLVETLRAELAQGRGVGIHCRIGVGRSALVAACVLAVLGVPLESAWAALQQARGMPVPDTAEQRVWVAAWVAGWRNASGSNAATGIISNLEQ